MDKTLTQYWDTLRAFLASPNYRRVTTILAIFLCGITIAGVVVFSPLGWKSVKLAINSHQKPDPTYQNILEEKRKTATFSSAEYFSFVKWLAQKTGDSFERRLRAVVKRNLSLMIVIPNVFAFVLHFLFTLIMAFLPNTRLNLIRQEKNNSSAYISLILVISYLGSLPLIKLMMLEL
jgi:hypothetical protein